MLEEKKSDLSHLSCRCVQSYLHGAMQHIEIPLHRFSEEVSYGEGKRDSGNPCMCSFGKSTYRVKTCCVSFSAKTVTGSWIIK